MTMNSEKIAIRILSITATLLFAALIFLPRPAAGEQAMKEGDFLIATHAGSGGSDAVYIAERTTGLIVAFTYDPQTKKLMPRALRPVADAFTTR
jgi:hypothetical protein